MTKKRAAGGAGTPPGGMGKDIIAIIRRKGGLSMMGGMLEHPQITRARATGYPEAERWPVCGEEWDQ